MCSCKNKVKKTSNTSKRSLTGLPFTVAKSAAVQPTVKKMPFTFVGKPKPKPVESNGSIIFNVA